MTHEQFLKAAQNEFAKQVDELRTIHEAAIRNEDWRTARYTQLRMWAISTESLNLECAWEDLNGEAA